MGEREKRAWKKRLKRDLLKKIKAQMTDSQFFTEIDFCVFGRKKKFSTNSQCVSIEHKKLVKEKWKRNHRLKTEDATEREHVN